MRARAAALLLVSIVGLLLVGVGLSLRLWRAGLRAATLTTEQRLRAIGQTAAQALAQGASANLLTAVARDNDLEAAYVLDEMLRPVSNGAGGGAALRINLLRIDPDRALQALRGQPSVGPAYRIEEAAVLSTQVLAGYFAVPTPPGQAARLVVLEAGAAFNAVPSQLRATALAAMATACGLALLCVLLVLAGLRAAAREQWLRAEAARGAAVREMAAMVAHELRNPLGTIRAGTELLREQAASPELTGDILDEVARLSELTTQFLQFSRDLPLHVGECDLAALGRELIERLRLEHPDGEALQLRCEGEDAVPLRGDPDRLRQVLRNLGQNAVQAMGGRGELVVSVRRLPGGGGELRASDTGPGVSAEARRSLFVPFHTTKPTGTGLGLVVSQRIAQQHGGSLTLAEASEGPGACFVLRLPAAPPRAGAAP